MIALKNCYIKEKLTIRVKRLLQRINKIRYILKAGIHWCLCFAKNGAKTMN